MADQFSRTELLFGPEAMKKLKNAHVAVFGVGGVGGHLAEALIRGGVGKLTLVDNDTVAESNLNRQMAALHSTLGMQKTEAAKKRLLDINPQAEILCKNVFFLPETADSFDFSSYDYVADAIDTVGGKVELILRCKAAGTPILCAMGAGNKLDPTAFRVADISKTSVCPLARAMRTQLRKNGIDHVKVVYSTEVAMTPAPSGEDSGKRQTPGSTSFVPSVVGLIMAGEILKDLAGIQ